LHLVGRRVDCVGESGEVLGRKGTVSSSESVGGEALRREFLPMGKYNQVNRHRSGETKVFFFKGKRVSCSEAQCVGCPDTPSRSIFHQIYPILLLRSQNFFFNSSVLKIHIPHVLCSVILVLNFPLTKQEFSGLTAALGLLTAVVYVIPSLYLCHLFPCH